MAANSAVRELQNAVRQERRRKEISQNENWRFQTHRALGLSQTEVRSKAIEIRRRVLYKQYTQSFRKIDTMPKLAIIATGVATALSLCGCGDSVSGKPVHADEIRMMAVTNLRLPSLNEADAKIVALHRREASAVAAPGAAIDTNGLIGRNRRYGKMISPRLQLGAGAALRVGLHGNGGMAINGFRAIEVGTHAIAPDGEVVSIKPPDAPIGAELSKADEASGAAFFMADACPALMALRSTPNLGAIADAGRQARVIAALDRGLRWLMWRANDLERIDRTVPNRLLYDALAYHGCGVLTGNKEAQNLSRRFVALALGQTRSDGVFVEKGGSDTTYQAVSVRLALDLLLTGYQAEDARQLNLAWQSGAIWLANRIMADGSIDSTGNTRTCKGGESFLGTEKKVWPPGVYGALIYAAELMPNSGINSAAGRLSAWARANPRADPCFSR
jgi:hypothetical protein